MKNKCFWGTARKGSAFWGPGQNGTMEGDMAYNQVERGKGNTGDKTLRDWQRWLKGVQEEAAIVYGQPRWKVVRMWVILTHPAPQLEARDKLTSSTETAAQN